MKLFIVTGTSRGLGFELCQELLKKDFIVIEISRAKKNTNQNLLNFSMENYQPGLKKLQKKLETMKNLKFKEIIFINNAATINPIGNFFDFSKKEVEQHLTINIEAPLMILKEINKSLKTKKITAINISSGAALTPIAGWSLYCAHKSMLHMLFETLALENMKNKTFINFYPGVMDTQMQVEIRNNKSKNFKTRDRFLELKRNQLLRSPQDVAQKLVTFINSEKISSGNYSIDDL